MNDATDVTIELKQSHFDLERFVATMQFLGNFSGFDVNNEVLEMARETPF